MALNFSMQASPMRKTFHCMTKRGENSLFSLFPKKFVKVFTKNLDEAVPKIVKDFTKNLDEHRLKNIFLDFF